MQDSEIVRLRDEEKLNCAEIARMLGVTRQYVSYQYRRAKGVPDTVHLKETPVTVLFGRGRYDYVINEKINQGKSYKDYIKKADNTTRRLYKFRCRNPHQ